MLFISYFTKPSTTFCDSPPYAQVSEAEKSNSALQAKVNQNALDLVALTTTKTALEKQVESLTARGKKDMEEIASLKRQLSEGEAGYQKSMQQAEKTISALQAKTKQDAFDLSALATLHKDLTSAKAAVDKQVETLSAQVEALTVQGKMDGDSILALKKRVAELEITVKCITEENELAENQISLLQTQGKKDKEAIVTWTAQGKRDSEEIAVLMRRVAELEAMLKQANGRTGLSPHSLRCVLSHIFPCTLFYILSHILSLLKQANGRTGHPPSSAPLYTFSHPPMNPHLLTQTNIVP